MTAYRYQLIADVVCRPPCEFLDILPALKDGAAIDIDTERRGFQNELF